MQVNSIQFSSVSPIQKTGALESEAPSDLIDLHAAPLAITSISRDFPLWCFNHLVLFQLLKQPLFLIEILKHLASLHNPNDGHRVDLGIDYTI